MRGLDARGFSLNFLSSLHAANFDRPGLDHQQAGVLDRLGLVPPAVLGRPVGEHRMFHIRKFAAIVLGREYVPQV